MLHNAHIKLVGGAQIKNMRPEVLTVDPDLASLFGARIWFNDTEKALKYYNGTSVETLAVGGNLTDYIRADGTVAMVGDLLLSSIDQTSSDAKAAVSKGFVANELTKKQDVLTGAASTVASTDLAASVAVVSDSNGKLTASTVTVAEVGQLTGVTAPIQTQLDGKQATIGYVPVNKSGDSFDGDIAMQGHSIIGLAKAVDPTSPVRLAEFDAAIAGLNWQDDVNGVQVDATLEPVAAEGNRYILTNVAALHTAFGTITGVANGDIVEYVGTEFVVAYDVSADPKALGTTAYAYDSNQFVRYEQSGWREFGGLSGVSAGVGLVKNGNVISVALGAGIAELPTNEVGIDLLAAGGLALVAVDENEANNKLAVKLADETLALSALGLAVKAGGINATHVAAATLGFGLQGGDGVTLSVKADQGIKSTATGVAVDTEFLDTRYVNADGDSITTLLVTGEITDAKHAVTKEFTENLVDQVADAVAALTARVGNGTYVYDGTAAAAVSHTVTHNLGNKYATVTVVDENDYVVGFDEVQYIDANTLVVSFVGAQKCRVIVTGVKAAV